MTAEELIERLKTMPPKSEVMMARILKDRVTMATMAVAAVAEKDGRVLLCDPELVAALRAQVDRQ